MPAKGPDPVAKALTALISKLTKSTAGRVFAILGRRLDKDVLPAIKQGLAHRNGDVAVAAIKVATDMRLTGTYPALRDLLRRRDKVAVSAARALGTVRDKEAVRPLVAVLSRGGDKSLKDAVAVSLRLITGKMYGFDTQKWEEYLANGLEGETASSRN